MAKPLPTRSLAATLLALGAVLGLAGLAGACGPGDRPGVRPEAQPRADLSPTAAARMRDYPGSELTVEQTLAPGVNYDRFIATYKSDGFKQYALLTIPRGPRPASGWPVVVFNHGFI